MLRIGKIDHILFPFVSRKNGKIILGHVNKASDRRQGLLKKLYDLGGGCKIIFLAYGLYVVLILIPNGFDLFFYTRISGLFRRKPSITYRLDLFSEFTVILCGKCSTDQTFIIFYGRHIIRCPFSDTAKLFCRIHLSEYSVQQTFYMLIYTRGNPRLI